MAWSIVTYAGTRATGQPSAYRTAMFELCRAINERETAMGAPITGLGLTTFYKADGTQTSNISMAQLEYLPCSGANSLAARNLEKIRTWITVTAPNYFTQGTGETPLVTESWLSTQVGYDLTQACPKVNDAAHWQALQDALDLLVYFYGTWNFTDSSFTGGGSNTYTTISDAWTNRNDISASPGGAGARANAVSPTGSWRAQWASSYTWTITDGVDLFYPGGNTGSFPQTLSAPTGGTMTAAAADYLLGGTEIATGFGWSAAGDSGTFSNGGGSGSGSISTWAIGGSTSITFTASVPSTLPFNEETSATGDTTTRSAAVSLDEVRVYYDITSELTDQS